MMADLGDVYRGTRRELCELVLSLPEDERLKDVPATSGWTIRDVIAHLTGDAVCTVASDFPSAFFAAFGEPEVLGILNEWTAKQVADRADRSIEELVAEWDEAAGPVEAMMRGETPWSDAMPMFADRVLVTDVGVHQQDIYGALGIQRGRDGVPVKLGASGYIATMGFRLGAGGLAPLAFDFGTKTSVAGDGGPAATVRASRFEFFRALSGRRSPDQIRAYDWDGDPEPYLHYFYPYGVREQALTE